MKLHPIIREYAETDSDLLEIVEKFYDKNQYLETVLLKLFKQKMDSQKYNQLMHEIDLAIISGHPDANVYLFFIVSVLASTFKLKQHEKSKSLYCIISSTELNEIHPMIKALCMQAKSYIRNIEGSFSESKQLMYDALYIVDQKSPRFLVLFKNYTSKLCSEGLLNGLSPLELKYLDVKLDEKGAYSILELKLWNCIIIGAYTDGYGLLNEFRQKFPDYNSSNINVTIALFKIVEGDLDESNYQDDAFKTLVRCFVFLLNNKIEETINCHQIILKNYPQTSAVLDEYLYINIEFLLGNLGMVRLLIKEKQEKRGPHFLDDLVYGRLFLIEKNFEAADEFFARLVENVKKYGAMNRIIFELQFAKEMKLIHIVNLTNGWQKKIGIKKQEFNKEKVVAKLNVKGIDLLIGKSSAINKVKELVRKFAPFKSPVLVTGETGTGKELVSRAIHDEGQYPNAPFLAINCGALTESLLQSELFGYVAGAFTGAQKERKGIFEAAGKGTVFLDEFGDISPQLQVSLLRVLESNEIRMIGSVKTQKIECRIVVATNVDLNQAVQEKGFREDLFYRLAKLEIRLPSLRERIEDLPELINYFFESNRTESENKKTLSSDLLQALSEYSWPGNIRELKNEVDRLSILHAEKPLIEKSDFDFTHLQAWSAQPKNKSEGQLKKESKVNDLPLAEQNNTEDPYLKIIQQKGPQIDRRHALLREIFQKYKKLTRNQIMGITNASPSTATKDLQILCEAGFIVRRSPTNSSRTFYFELVET
jgi:DNA-binding NtrC family response regulator